jgi:hypothetical protein
LEEAGEYDITIEQGSGFTLPITYEAPEGEPVDFTGSTARLHARLKFGSADKVIVEESGVRVVTIGQQGPPEPAGGDGADVTYVDTGDATSRQRANHTGTQLASTISDFSTAVDSRVGIQKGAANGLATLGSDNKIPSAQLPAIAITDTFPVASQAAMLALTAEVGDVDVRSDLNKSFILRAAGASTLGNWQELLTPTDAVLSVNGQTGAVGWTRPAELPGVYGHPYRAPRQPWAPTPPSSLQRPL